MNARLEATAKAYYETEVSGTTYEQAASDILAAADAVMFSEQTVECVAAVLKGRLGPALEGDALEWEMDARAVIAAIQGAEQ